MINFASKTKGTATVCPDGHLNKADCKAAMQAKMEELNRETAEKARGKSSMSSAAPEASSWSAWFGRSFESSSNEPAAAPAAKEESSAPAASSRSGWFGLSSESSSNEPAAAPQKSKAYGTKTEAQLKDGDWF